MMMRAAGLVVVLGMAVAGPAAAQVTSLPAEVIAGPLLAAHNAERQRLGIGPLVWSAKLAHHARTWSQSLAVADMIEHSVSAADGSEGENLWFGARDAYTVKEMVGFFIGEGRKFKRGVFPKVSATGRWEDVGHYTQLIWQDTREVGCALTSNPRRDVLVCRYWPMGNIVGQKVFAGPAQVSLSERPKRASKKHRRGG
jgi:hypothetical protein